MPYIRQHLRKALVAGQVQVQDRGELNFALTYVINEYLKSEGLSYGTINDILGALSGAKAEFYRRVAVPYEQRKLIENGDVYDPEFVL
jgi:hypothetical protein